MAISETKSFQEQKFFMFIVVLNSLVSLKGYYNI